MSDKHNKTHLTNIDIMASKVKKKPETVKMAVILLDGLVRAVQSGDTTAAEQSANAGRTFLDETLKAA